MGEFGPCLTSLLGFWKADFLKYLMSCNTLGSLQLVVFSNHLRVKASLVLAEDLFDLLVRRFTRHASIMQNHGLWAHTKPANLFVLPENNNPNRKR